jgi:putative flippase GtrA
MPAAALTDLIRTPSGRRFVRYCSLSAFNVLFGQALLIFFHSGLGMPGWLANLTAIIVGTGPAYLISRRWVWEKTGKHSLSGEVLPFWALNGLGTVLSTLFVAVADVIWSSALAVSAASISAWFLVWVLKYFTMDRVVFRAREPVVTA